MKIFLSASVPLPDRNPRFFETADVIGIREAIKGLVLVLLERHGHLVFGGHPAITPLVRLLFNEAGRSPREHVTLYQSAFFRNEFPEDNTAFEHLVVVEPVGTDREASLRLMRQRMLRENGYSCGIFIGGMEGVIEEFKIFRKFQPRLPAFPIASTGAAAQIIYRENALKNFKLEDELTYPTLFRNILPPT